MVGGEDDALRRARPVLEAMGKKITHFGGPGQGQNAKVRRMGAFEQILNL